jgi:superfamily I DNA/RNA helicase
VYFREFGIDINEDLFLRGKAFRNGPEPEVILTDRFNEAEVVINKVLYLKEEKGIPLSEIAVLFYYRQYEPERYYIFNWLKDKLNIYYLEYSELISTDESYGVLYGDRRGLSLCTIESSLGLDFQAIIICGLKALGAYYKTKKTSTFSSDVEELEQYKEDFYKNVNTLYTACTRARDYLCIVLTESGEKSIYSRLLLDSVNG